MSLSSSSNPNNDFDSSLCREIDFSVFKDYFILTLAKDLKIDKFARRRKLKEEIGKYTAKEMSGACLETMTPAEVRQILTDFVKSHPEAEKQVAHLILKYVGIRKSVFYSQRRPRDISATSEGVEVLFQKPPFEPTSGRSSEPIKEEENCISKLDNLSSSPDLHSPFPLRYKEDILPNLSPVPWLSENSWASMTYNEKFGFMEHVLLGTFRSEHHLPSKHDLYFPTSHMFQKGVVSFGIGGVDRVVLGHGPRRVLVIVGIHGNEYCGVEAVRLILQKHALFTGHAGVTSEELRLEERWERRLEDYFDCLTIEFLIGNPAALARNTRFLKRNLNRLFDIHTLCDDARAEEEGYNYELQRARLITESIRNSDFVLDIHSCSSDVRSFALPSSMDLSEELAELLPVKYVVESLVHATVDGGTTLDCALLHDVPGICVECGQHSHPNVVARAAAVISSFLSMQVLDDEGSFTTDDVAEAREKPIAMRCEFAERVSHGFEWINQFPEFHFVRENTPVFRDKDRGDVTCPIKGGAYLVMPTASPVLGEEALFWASAKQKL